MTNDRPDEAALEPIVPAEGTGGSEPSSPEPEQAQSAWPSSAPASPADESVGSSDGGDGEAAEVLPAWVQRLDEDRSQIIPLSKALSPVEQLAQRASQADPPRSGILVIDKPAGRTSFDVVKAVRKASGERRVGHAGTLDPMATGVLVVCFGTATRVVEEIQAGRKTYLARITLGRETTTYDAEGEVVAESDVAAVELQDIERELEAFRGDIEQVPPMYSALKRQGKPLYELARKGIEVERAARPVTVYALRVVDWTSPDLSVEMTVSKGTYVRSIAHDLGHALGVGAHLSALRRTAVGAFDLTRAERLARVVEAFVEGWWPMLTYPLDAALVHYSAMVVDADGTADMRHGRQFDGPAPRSDTSRLVRIYSDRGAFVGLASWDPIHERWQPARVFPVAKTDDRPSGKP
jgi:tRNA pseudouridine55 synthase